ncbi:ferrochelatase [Pseudoalteromonas piscicida]|uniref:Ferrochelatase n=1 Tax=Pseudoalteromonas piscicida TaxID=43662 RepID=A0AAQ2ESL4_PSEO7|nr:MULTISPECIES: ferrochelatase [Pseudoalteromonas]TMN40602.1 ferrochelatase [Pseudoalteromonas piscicida]TMN42045.1 ferrochelatase [Pseudoalteromonas piscicida]TMN50904.1 ferrochelatase [Pseudoalteromonas piscicida]TMN57190.1 ferrochelatase [Pseudoalteromonas piscicida]TMN59481.1 ferrochelatase [Pseudoalteromonas piscicida]
MSRFSAITDNPHEGRFNSKTGILITNLGSPDAPTAKALRVYLAEFLSDPRIVEIPRLIWLMILHGIILRVRPKKSAHAYQSIWTDEGSPLITISRAQTDKIEKQLRIEGFEDIEVELAMRYGNPSIESGLEKLRDKGITRIIIVPLYPQYSSATTGSTFDQISKVLRAWRWVPELHFINGYHKHPLYIESLANSIREDLEANGEPDKLVFSYHGTPKLFLDRGDPYHCFCQQTTRLVVEKLNLDKEKVMTTFQSRFGKAEWLQPYTDKTLESFPSQGIKNVAILSPAFSADCLETLEELEVENREVFESAGGEKYRYIPALNDRDDHIKAITALIKPLL